MRGKIYLLVMLSIAMTRMVQAQRDSARITELDEVFISANKFQEKKKNIAQSVQIITAKTIAQANTQNTGDLLINTGNVFVQKSQQGGSSPVLRGFEASRILLLIDGVRLNNAIFRAGHLQNVITVDQNMLDRVEIMFGPASTLYGSDALGGVIHLRTKSPSLSNSRQTRIQGTAFTRYSSANEEKTLHADLSIGGKKFGWLQAYTFSDFGDMKMGDQYPSAYPDFGRRTNYVSRINGIDSVVKNSDDRVQRFSGYKQWDITQKFLFKPSGNSSHQLNLQLSNTTDVPRYDRLQDIRNGTLRYAEWYYGPQKRIMGSYQFNYRPRAVFDQVQLTASYQHIEESRQTRDYRRYDRFDSRRERVKVAGLTVDFQNKWKKDELTTGVDMQLNDLKSVADRRNLLTEVTTALDTRYPDGKNKMNYYAAFAQHLHKFGEGKWVLNDGIRFQLVTLHSTIVNNSFFTLPFTDISQDNFSVTGNLGLNYIPTKDARLSLVFSSGFRAPNIDDLAKIFESSTSLRQVVFPNPDIKPEYTYNFEFNLNKSWGHWVSVDAGVFYTFFRNALVKAPFKLNGQDSVDYNGQRSQVLATQNLNKAYVTGVNAAIRINPVKNLFFTGTFNYTRGRFETDPSKNSSVYQKQNDGTYKLVSAAVSSKPLDHIPPVFGKAAVQYTRDKWDAEFFLLYNGWKKLDDYNADGEDNAQYATADGMPAWTTLNLKASVLITQNVRLQGGIENLLDRNYRYFASGFSAPGRNFLIALRVQF